MENNREKSINKINCSSGIRPTQTPAITMVDGCNKAEIGVGVDVAFNDRLVNGNWADLEKRMKIKTRETKDIPRPKEEQRKGLIVTKVKENWTKDKHKKAW